MDWRLRLQEMVLAGGALAAAACANNHAETPEFFGEAGCGNANPDGCLLLAYCGGPGPDSSVYIACEQDRAACQSRGGFLEDTSQDGSFVCWYLPEAGPGDAGDAQGESGPSDAGADGSD
jgi:hypothetical protein